MALQDQGDSSPLTLAFFRENTHHTRRPRLFQFLHGQTSKNVIHVPNEAEVVSVTIGGNRLGDSNDLMTCLSTQLSPPPGQPELQQCIFEPSDVVAFELTGSSVPSSAWSFGSKAAEAKIFKFPKHLYMDQFLQVNAVITSTKRVQQREISDEVEKLILKRKSLTSFNVSSIPFYIFCFMGLAFMLCDYLRIKIHLRIFAHRSIITNMWLTAKENQAVRLTLSGPAVS